LTLSKPPSPLHWREIYLAVALTTMATLLMELSLTRIFSVVFAYHFAFLAISIALFGLGLGGVASYVVAGWTAPLFTKLGWLSGVNSLLVVLALAVILGQGDHPGIGDLALIYFTSALPFLVSGTIVSLVIGETIERVNRIYFFDLVGAAAGCFLLLALLPLAGGPGAVIGAAITFAAAAAIWHSLAGSVPARAGNVALALALMALLVYNQKHGFLDVDHAKGQAIANEVFRQWNSFSRVAVKEKANGEHSIVIDADTATDIAHVSQESRDPGPALPYHLRPAARTLIIGPGGGRDVARAIASGSRDVTAVEINPIISRVIMRERFPDLSNGLYLRPEVHLYEEDGRAFVRRSSEKFQVIQATLVDTWAATAAGAFALTENNLYTTDAFRDYLGHLTDDGILAMTRRAFDPPRESLRLISLAMEALHQMGERDAWRHIVVARQGSVQGNGALDTVLVWRKPLSESDIANARAAIDAAKMEAVYYPGSQRKNPFRALLLSPNPAEYQAAYPYDISPVSDNRPFFFYTVQPRDVWTYMNTAARGAADFKINSAVPMLFGLAAISLLATLAVLIAPPIVLGTRLPTQPGVRGFLVYFLLIGAGYVLIEVGLIEKFVLFLGSPTYALAVVIFSMLLSTGVGSLASERLLGADEGRLIKALGGVAMLTALLGAVLSTLLSALVGLPMVLKMTVTVLLIAPLGFGMGMPFPAGLKHLAGWHAPSVRWAWSLNAASSVLGSVTALMCSIYLGLVQTLIIGGLLYLGALAVIARVRIEGPTAPEPGTNRVVLAN
jgi:spermidine synthase